MGQLFTQLQRGRSRILSRIPTIVMTTLVSSAVVTLGVMGVRVLGGLQGTELRAYDQWMQRRPVLPLDERVVVVEIDETFIQTQQEYPIHDDTLAALFARLETYEPRVIGLDVGRDFPQGEGRAALQAEIAGSDRIVTSCLMSGLRNPGVPPAPGTPPERTAFADLARDPDGIIRRSILVSTPAEPNVPMPVAHLCNQVEATNQLVSLALATSLSYLEVDGVFAEPTAAGEIQLGAAVLKRLGDRAAGYHATGATDYQILLNYRSETNAVRQVGISEVLNGTVNPDWIRDRLVLIGYTSPVAKDESATPFSGGGRDVLFMPGVVIHAQAASQLIAAAEGDRPLLWYWPLWGEFVWVLGWAMVGGFVAYANRRFWVFVGLEGAAILGLYALCLMVFLQWGGWLPWVPSAIALLVSGIGVALLDRADEGGYTQAVYEQVRDQVKGLVQPKIEIDSEKRAKQVAEITETGYFQDLVSRAKAIREERERAKAATQSPGTAE